MTRAGAECDRRTVESVTLTVRQSQARYVGRSVLIAVPLGFFGVFFAYPVASLIGLGLTEGDKFAWTHFHAVLGDPAMRSVLWFTIWQALVSTLVTLAIALPGAYVIARFDFPGKPFIQAGVLIPFVLPTVVVGAAFLGLIGPAGLLGVRLDGTVTAIVLAHVFFNYAVVIRTVGGVWAQLDTRKEEAARVLGANKWQAWSRITLPALTPAITGVALIVFLFTFTSFGIIRVLGDSGRSTLEVEIYRQTAQLLNLPVAAVLSMLQLGCVLSVLVLHASVTRQQAVATRLSGTSYARRPQSARQWVFVGLNLAVLLLLLAGPIVVLIERSFATSTGYGFDYYESLFRNDHNSALYVAPLTAISNSLTFAGAATAIALAVGGIAAWLLANTTTRWSKAVDAILMVPLGTSAVTVGFGFVIALDEPPFDLRESWILVPIAQALVGIPFVVRSLIPVIQGIDQRARSAAAVLGASPWRVWREVDLPVLWRGFLAAAGFAFAVSLGEFGATTFLARPDNPTVPIAIFRLLSRAGEFNYGQAMALSTILVALCGGAVLAVDRLRPTGAGEFQA